MKTFSVPFEKRSHELEALIKVKLILDVNFFTFVDESQQWHLCWSWCNFPHFIGNAFYVSFSLTKIVNKKMIVVTSQVERWEAWSKLCLLELKVAYVVRCSSILPCEMAMVSHHIIKWTLADPAVCWVKFPINPLDIVFKHFNKYLSNFFFILAVCPRDDWLLWIKLIVITNDMLLLFICETLITPSLTATYWFYHKGYP